MTSKLPFESLTNMQIMKKVCLEGALPDMSLVIDGCPEVLTDLMTQCLAQEPHARPSFASLVPTLQDAEAMAAGAARPAGAAITATLRVKRPGGGAVEERIQVRRWFRWFGTFFKHLSRRPNGS